MERDRDIESDNVVANSAHIEASVRLGHGVIIEDNVHIMGDTTIGDGVYIGAGSRIENAHIGEGTHILNSEISNAYIGHSCNIGPYAHIHKGARLGDGLRVGNFVEIKNSTLGDGTKAAHLAYIGDVDIGRCCNIGCGAIFVNYDGVTKRRSKVGDGVFIGSNANVIAPVTIEDGAYLAAGSTLTCDLRRDDMCIARAREVIKPNRSKYKPFKGENHG